MAESGQFGGFSDPIKAQLARLSSDERDHVQKIRAEYFAVQPTNKEEAENEFF